MPQLNKLSAITLQDQLSSEIRHCIETGVFKEGSKIPTEAELSENFGVSRVTVRRAIQILVDEGLVVRKAGKGTFVKCVPHTEATHTSAGFSENCRSQGRIPTTSILKRKTILCPKDLSVLADKHNSITEVWRLRSVDGTPCIVEIDRIPHALDYFDESTQQGISYLDALARKHSIDATQFIDTFSIVNASKEFAEYLSCNVDTPLLVVNQQVLDSNDRLIYQNTQYILTEVYVYVKASS